MAQDSKYLDMRKMLARMRGADKDQPVESQEQISESFRNMNIREMKKRMKKFVDLQEAEGATEALSADKQKEEEDKLRNVFTNNNVTIEFQPFKITHDKDGKRAMFGGTVDGQILFRYDVAPTEENSGVSIEYLSSFDPNDTENEQIIEMLKRYYNDFYQNWRDQLFYR
ncbi:MAG: hypothetical protein HC836_15690 [Richelia sp. RM2_1_2]|nr:hypothetical protein [Richelia sp. RM2_1_2]